MITTQLVSQVADAVAINADIFLLRSQFPELHFTECSADDVNARFLPVAETAGHELYLISGASGHCLELTTEYDGATGIVVAAKADE